jgi:hypothetical protein
MAKEEISNELPKSCWSIDLDWFQENHRSISILVQNYLCAKCDKQLTAKGKKESPNALMVAIKSCCSRAPDFINERLPILESIFRFFLSNGNKPLDIEELGKQLNVLRGGDPYRTSTETLSRLLKNDSYYGLREVQN